MCTRHRESFEAGKLGVLSHFYGRVEPDIAKRMKEVIEAEEPEMGPSSVRFYERFLALIDAFAERHSGCNMRICNDAGMEGDIRYFTPGWRMFKLYDDTECDRLSDVAVIEDEERRVEEARTRVESLKEQIRHSSRDMKEALRRKMDDWEHKLSRRESWLAMEQKQAEKAEDARRQSSEYVDLLKLIESTLLKQPPDSKDENANEKRVTALSEEPFPNDDVFYIGPAGLVIARLLAFEHARLQYLAPNVTLSTFDDGSPVEIAVSTFYQLWDLHDKVEIGVPVRPGKVVFKAPTYDYYWFEEEPTVKSTPEGSRILFEFAGNPPHEGIRISPRVVILIGGSGELSGFYFSDLQIRGSLDPLADLGLSD